MADQGFPAGGCRPPMQALFGENGCENERIESRRGGGDVRRARPLDPPVKITLCETSGGSRISRWADTRHDAALQQMWGC